MRLKDYVNVTLNKANNQISFNIRLKVLRSNKTTISKLLDWPEPIQSVSKLK